MTEDILERAKAADLDLLAIIDWGKLRDLFGELIAEVERLRSLNESLMENGNDLRTRCQKAEARIKELEANNKRLEAEFLEATKEIVYATHEGRDAPEGEDVYAEKVASEALEQLRAEGKIGGGDGE